MLPSPARELCRPMWTLPHRNHLLQVDPFFPAPRPHCTAGTHPEERLTLALPSPLTLLSMNPKQLQRSSHPFEANLLVVLSRHADRISLTSSQREANLQLNYLKTLCLPILSRLRSSFLFDCRDLRDMDRHWDDLCLLFVCHGREICVPKKTNKVRKEDLILRWDET